MLYSAYQALADLVKPLRAAAGFSAAAWRSAMVMNPPWTPYLRRMVAASEMLARLGLTHVRPDYQIKDVLVRDERVGVREEAVFSTPFGTLLRFAKDTSLVQPKVLIVAPLSGHFATLLRATVATMLPDHDVYITDWHNARDVPLSAGRFGFAEYVEHVIRFFEVLGPGAHLVGVCQPCAHALAAISLMAADDHPDQPRSMTLMAGPIDTRINPTKVNELATGKSIKWFEQNLISTVPLGFKGQRRRVYPGFTQLTAFMSMNPDRHVKAHKTIFRNLVDGKMAEAHAAQNFYDEYFAVLDLTAEFYLETVQMVFQDHLLPKGELMVNGRKVEPARIRRTALLTVEGERDDICSIGQTMAAHDLCSGLRPYLKRHHLQAGVGHYGVFSGTRWDKQIYPIVRNVILSNH